MPGMPRLQGTHTLGVAETSMRYLYPGGHNLSAPMGAHLFSSVHGKGALVLPGQIPDPEQSAGATEVEGQ